VLTPSVAGQSTDVIATRDLRVLVLRTLMPGFVGLTVPSWLSEAIEGGLGSVCLYGSNVENQEQLRDLCSQLHRPGRRLTLAVDEEGGDVTRVHHRTGSPQPGNAVLGRLDDVAGTWASAWEIGAELAELGIDLDLAPVVDVNSCDANPVIGTRSFGSDPVLVARHGAAWIEGLQASGVAACAKHFPGHGDTMSDSHLTLPVATVPEEVLRERELLPFRVAIDSHVACVMSATIVVPSVDPEAAATFSSTFLQGVLRRELGFTGVIVSDALDMAAASAETGVPQAAVRALIAGCDLLCLGSDTPQALLERIVAAVLQAVKTGRLPVERLRDAADAVDRLSSRPAAATAAPARGALRVADAFDLSRVARSWINGGGHAVLVQVESSTNMAVGDVPWGPAAAGLTVDEAQVGTADRVAVVGRNIDVGHPAWDVATRFRNEGKAVIVVECGWPRGGADVVVRSGSPEVARHLATTLQVPPPIR